MRLIVLFVFPIWSFVLLIRHLFPIVFYLWTLFLIVTHSFSHACAASYSSLRSILHIFFSIGSCFDGLLMRSRYLTNPVLCVMWTCQTLLIFPFFLTNPLFSFLTHSYFCLLVKVQSCGKPAHFRVYKLCTFLYNNKK